MKQIEMKPVDVLFLCETNAAASLMAEALVNHRGDLRLRAFSAGRSPHQTILGEASAELARRNVPAEGLQPKPLDIFTFPGAPMPDIIVDLATVTWIKPAAVGAGRVLRWPLQDPALVAGRAERRSVTREVLAELVRRIDGELMRLVSRAAPVMAVAGLATGIETAALT